MILFKLFPSTSSGNVLVRNLLIRGKRYNVDMWNPLSTNFSLKEPVLLIHDGYLSAPYSLHIKFNEEPIFLK